MSPNKTGREKARCPECLAAIWVRDDIELWDPITCPECHAALQVVRLRPLELDYLDEDWEDDDYEDEG
ncbi:MAG: hypothetical protein Kow00124_21250 [Anaerolineae bacterium]